MQQQIQQNGAPVTIIHFSYNAGSVYLGTEERIACMPNMKEFGETMYHPNYQRSNDFRAVNCPACKRTDVFLGAERAHNVATKK